MSEIDITYALEDTASGFEITNDAQAERALREILDNEAERDRLAKLALDMVGRYMEQRTAIIAKYDRMNEWNKTALRNYFNKVEKRETKTTKCYNLLSGRLVQKKKQPLYAYVEEKLIDWAYENAPELVKEQHKTSLDWAGLKKQIKVINGIGYWPETGEELPITVNEQEDEFIIEGGKNG